MEELIALLNKASEAYYNSDSPIMSDAEFDKLLGQLKTMETESGIIMSNSPTINVGAKVLTKLNTVKHSHPMLSLAKVHTADEILKFADGHELAYMLKLDGLSVSIKYVDGELVSAETRGDGESGSDITEHIKLFQNVPLHIKKSGVYVIDGEAIITYDDFALINVDGKFKNPRNTASGALSLLDTSLVKDRKLSFIAWDVIDGSDENYLHKKLTEASSLGFTVVPFGILKNSELNSEEIDDVNNSMYRIADAVKYPIDGVVYKVNDVVYGKTLGRTEHHFNLGRAWKPEQEEVITSLRSIEWNTSRTGVINPVAIFDPVQIDGSEVSRATLHNLDYMNAINISIGAYITVIKANQIIPRVTGCRANTPHYFVPEVCPCCGEKAAIKNGVVYCTNADCKAQLLSKFENFVSKKCMNIDGLSSAALEYLIDSDSIKTFADVYTITNNEEKIYAWEHAPGFGKVSVKKFIAAIEKSRTTTLDKVIAALGIPNVGVHTAKDIAKYCKGDVSIFIDETINHQCVSLNEIPGVGEETSKSIRSWMDKYGCDFMDLIRQLNIQVQEVVGKDLTEVTFVITGSLNHFSNRDEAIDIITALGGKVSNSVSAKTNYLVNNDVNSTSSKNKKAKDLGIPIITENELLTMIS